MAGYPQYAIYLLQGQSTTLAEIKADVATVKTDVAGVKTDVAGVKTDTNTVKGKIVPKVNKPKEADISSTLNQDIWATLIDLTSGEGVINRVELCCSQILTNANYIIELTIDGITQTLKPAASVESRGIGGDSSMKKQSVHSLMGPFAFSTSFKIRVKHDYAGSLTLKASVDYGLV